MKRKLAQAEALRLQEIQKAKNQLFANITHEFRTPLTLILGPTERAKKRAGKMTGEELRVHFSTVEKNGQLLLGRVNQLLDLNKIEAGLMECHFEQADAVPFLKYLFESFHSFAEAQKIDLSFQTDTGACLMDVDREKWTVIISNLLANAIKFTPEGGAVHLFFAKKENGERVEISVEDTGIGIPPEELPRVFERFHQVDMGGKKTAHGTGIGLALVKEYVRLLDGEVSVESEPGKGTGFTVSLPVRNEAPPARREGSELPVAIFSKNQSPEDQLEGDDLPLALIIEDNEDVARFIGQCLEKAYRLAFAENGKLGIERAAELVPDCIISDVMMPEMDGYEVCAHLKNQELTAHIPVILLTAKADMDSKIHGLRTGADAYLTKPFNEEELMVRVEKMMELRDALRKKFGAEATGETEAAPDFFTTDDPFLQKVNDLINAHLDDTGLNPERLAAELFYSRMQVHRKIKALTDLSTSKYIRTYRLHRSLEMLRSGHLHINEIAYQTGFSSPSYFSTSFKELFGMTPMEWRENH